VLGPDRLKRKRRQAPALGFSHPAFLLLQNPKELLLSGRAKRSFKSLTGDFNILPRSDRLASEAEPAPGKLECFLNTFRFVEHFFT
jgi:hypothetical protein